MIGKVTRGRDLSGLLRYLFGPGRANEHTRPHLVASWRGDDTRSLADLDPACRAGRPNVAGLTARMLLPLQLQPEVDRPVWQCSMRTAPTDRTLTDAEWAGIARDVVQRTGFAPHGDDAACRWVAVRHADDHIHIAVVLARMDGQPVELFRDWPKVHAAARAAEHRLGLQIVAAPSRADRKTSRSPTRAEIEKTHRTTLTHGSGSRRPPASHGGSGETPRCWLTRQIRETAEQVTNHQKFGELLEQRGVLVTWRHSRRDPTQVTGYAVGRPGDVDADGLQVWFGGSKLRQDLSLPQLRSRWAEAAALRNERAESFAPREGQGTRRALRSLAPLKTPGTDWSPFAAIALRAADAPAAARVAIDIARAIGAGRTFLVRRLSRSRR